jgi:predicted small secreted protein
MNYHRDIRRFIPFLLILIAIFLFSGLARGEEDGDCSESGDHSVASWVRIFATPADPMPSDIYAVNVSVEVLVNGSWSKEWNDTIGELVRKPDSPSPQVIDRQNGTEEGIRLQSSEAGLFRVWAGICRNNKSYWNFSEVIIEARNQYPVSIALLGTENGTTWSTSLNVWIVPGEDVTIFFNGSLSHDPDGDDLHYFWYFKEFTHTDLTGPWVSWTFTSTGIFPIALVVKDGNESAESTAMLKIHYEIYPDLNLTTAPFLSNDEIESGEPVNVTASIQNQGENVSGSFQIYVYDQNLDTGASRIIYKTNITSLEVNEFFTLSFTWTTTNLVEPGQHSLMVLVDAENDVTEENESNNLGWGKSFRITSEQEDLAFVTIKDMSVSNNTPYLNHMVNITLTIGNSGIGPAELLTIFLFVNGEEYDKRYLPYIGPGEDETIILFYSPSLMGSFNLTCTVFDNGFFQGSEGRRIVVQDLEGPIKNPKNDTSSQEESDNLDWLMMGAGIFMIVMAVAIQIVGKKARAK